TGPNFDVTTLILNRPLEIRGTGDSEYRDSLARSLKESSRRNLNTKTRRLPDSEPIRSDQSTKHSFGNQSSNTEVNRREVSNTPNERTTLKRPPTQEDRPGETLVKPDDNSETPENVTLTDVGEISSREESDILEGEQILEIQAVIGMPPAQFQPFIITTIFDEDVTTEIEGEEISYSLLEGRAHARFVIENLINRFEISPDQGPIQNSEALTPPAGLFQALKALDKHGDTSENPSENNLGLPDEISIDPDTQIASVIDSAEFEVAPADASIEIDGTVSSRQLESDITYQVEVTQDLAVESGLIESALIGIQPQETAVRNSQGENSGFESPQQAPEHQAAALEGKSANTVVNAAQGTEPTDGTRPAVSTGPSQSQNSSDLSVGEIPEKDHSGKIKSSTKQTATRLEVNSKKLLNRVAAAIRSAGQNGRLLRIRLQPPELGTLEIEVSSRNGVLSARLEVQTASAQKAILENMSLLRDALAQNGTRLENIDVHLNERLNEGGQTDLSKEQQQQDEQQSEQEHQQDDSDQSPDENESESRQNAVGIATQIDQLDIQI
ncbi:MAG: flagellar hook-length control protein FliK, partial [Planctomycetes bacterium]|nr:flagellar hook-length control protein FliK [Planctomycetota bacterium]